VKEVCINFQDEFSSRLYLTYIVGATVTQKVNTHTYTATTSFVSKNLFFKVTSRTGKSFLLDKNLGARHFKNKTF